MIREQTLYLSDILTNMRNAEEFVEGLSLEEFRQDIKTLYAVVRCFEIIGEAAKNIPDSVRDRYPDIPWKEMAGMRDKVVHFYFGVDPEKVWLTLKDRIPEVKEHLAQVLEDLSVR